MMRPDAKVQKVYLIPSTNRARKVALCLLHGYRGYLLTDDYAYYNDVAAQGGIDRLDPLGSCTAPVRRSEKSAA